LYFCAFSVFAIFLRTIKAAGWLARLRNIAEQRDVAMTGAPTIYGVGEVAVTKIPELALTFPASTLPSDWDPAVAADQGMQGGPQSDGGPGRLLHIPPLVPKPRAKSG
jgi:hypothetical protein